MNTISMLNNLLEVWDICINNSLWLPMNKRRIHFFTAKTYIRCIICVILSLRIR